MKEDELMDAFGSEGNWGLSALMKTPLAKLDAVQTWIFSNRECPGRNTETKIARFQLKINDR